MFQILINREEKENFFFKILKIEKRKRMKIQFFRARGSERGQYFSRFLEIRDSCPCLGRLPPYNTSYTLVTGMGQVGRSGRKVGQEGRSDS